MMQPACHYNGHCMEGPNCPECATITIARSNGGFVMHVFDPDWVGGPGDRRQPALCGYTPSSPGGYLIRNRGRWRESLRINLTEANDHVNRWCPKCREKLEKQFDIDLT